MQWHKAVRRESIWYFDAVLPAVVRVRDDTLVLKQEQILVGGLGVVMYQVCSEVGETRKSYVFAPGFHQMVKDKQNRCQYAACMRVLGSSPAYEWRKADAQDQVTCVTKARSAST